MNASVHALRIYKPMSDGLYMLYMRKVMHQTHMYVVALMYIDKLVDRLTEPIIAANMMVVHDCIQHSQRAI